jgi:hypothetical protein
MTVGKKIDGSDAFSTLSTSFLRTLGDPTATKQSIEERLRP